MRYFFYWTIPELLVWIGALIILVCLGWCAFEPDYLQLKIAAIGALCMLASFLIVMMNR